MASVYGNRAVDAAQSHSPRTVPLFMATPPVARGNSRVSINVQRRNTVAVASQPSPMFAVPEHDVI
jgi:hypothetical protein